METRGRLEICALEAEGARFDNRPDVGLREKELSRPWFQLAGVQRSG